MLHVVNHGDERGVGGVNVRADGVELEAEGADLRLVDRGERHDRCVAAPLELERDGDEGVDVAVGADVGQNDAHERVLRGQVRDQRAGRRTRRYEGNASTRIFSCASQRAL